MSKAFQAFCDSKGIKRELSTPYNPPQNEVVERMNQIIQDRVHTMLSHVALPHGFVQIHKEEHNKLEPKSCKCIFLGYGDGGEMRYRLWDPEKKKSTQ